MNNDDIRPLTVTVEQAARLLGIGRSTAYELVHTGDIPSLRLGRRVVVPISRLAALVGSEVSEMRQGSPSSFSSATRGPTDPKKGTGEVLVRDQPSLFDI